MIDASSFARMFVAPVNECEMMSPADTVVICPPPLTWVTIPFLTSWVYCAPVVIVIGPWDRMDTLCPELTTTGLGLIIVCPSGLTMDTMGLSIFLDRSSMFWASDSAGSMSLETPDSPPPSLLPPKADATVLTMPATPAIPPMPGILCIKPLRSPLLLLLAEANIPLVALMACSVS